MPEKLFTSPPDEQLKIGKEVVYNHPLNLAHCMGFKKHKHRNISCIQFLFTRHDVYWFFKTVEERDECFIRLERVYSIARY